MTTLQIRYQPQNIGQLNSILAVPAFLMKIAYPGRRKEVTTSEMIEEIHDMVITNRKSESI